MARPTTTFAVAALTALAATLATTSAQECTGWVIDPAWPWGSAYGAMSGDRVAMTRTGTQVPPAVEIYGYEQARDTYVLQGTLDDPGWTPFWQLRHIALDGDVLAFKPRAHSAVGQICVIGERMPGHWQSTSVSLVADPWLNQGQLTAVSGDRVAVLTGRHTSHPFVLHVIERSAMTGWAVTDRIVSQVATSGWFENDATLVLDGDIAAYTMSGMTPEGTVVVVERDGSGTWQETNLLPPSGSVFQTVSSRSLAIDGERITILLRQWPATDQLVALVYRRSGLGSWAVEQRIIVETPWPFSNSFTSLAMGDGQLAITTFGGDTRQYELNAQGRYEITRGFTGLGFVFAVNASRIAGGRGEPLRIARSEPGSPRRTLLCTEFGSTICDDTDPTAPTLSLHQNPDPVLWRDRLARITNAPPGASVQLFVTADPGRRVLGAGVLCLDSPTLVSFGPPVALDATGSATIVMTGSTIPVSTVSPDTFYTQAFVMGSPARLTNAVRFIFL